MRVVASARLSGAPAALALQPLPAPRPAPPALRTRLNRPRLRARDPVREGKGRPRLREPRRALGEPLRPSARGRSIPRTPAPEVITWVEVPDTGRGTLAVRTPEVAQGNRDKFLVAGRGPETRPSFYLISRSSAVLKCIFCVS
ncbi:Protein Njmu-R1 [Manis pentadactyla]|nr:Protein Njmu-R1 [Manis pentadactyla]